MNVEQLAAQVARQTGIRLSVADPIFSVAAIHETLFNDAIVKMDRAMKAEADRITAASTQAVLDAKREAELLITEGGAWAERRIKEAGQEAGAMMLANLRQESAEAKRAGRFATRTAWLAGVELYDDPFRSRENGNGNDLLELWGICPEPFVAFDAD